MHTHKTYFLLILSLMFVASACQKKRKNDVKSNAVKKFFVHGDPHTLIQGTIFNPLSFVSEAAMAEFSNYDLTGGAVFFQKSEKRVVKEGETVETGNEAETGDDLNIIVSYQFTKDASGDLIYSSNDKEGQILKFSPNNAGQFELTAWGENPVKALHYSITPDKNTFSILGEATDEVGYVLFAMTFSKNLPPAAPKANVDPSFNYILGPGVLAGWQKEIRIDICGPHDEASKQMLLNNSKLWATDPEQTKIGTMPLVIRELPNPAPFNDVNQSCLQMVSNFLFEDADEFVVTGVTFPSINKSSRTIMSSNIFISVSGIQKIQGGDVNSITASTIVHEFGHYLGLHHEFEDASIMGYDNSVTEILPRDRQAIEYLYGQ